MNEIDSCSKKFHYLKQFVHALKHWFQQVELMMKLLVLNISCKGMKKMLQMADKNVLKNAIQESVKLQSCANKTNKDNHIPVSAKT